MYGSGSSGPLPYMNLIMLNRKRTTVMLKNTKINLAAAAIIFLALLGSAEAQTTKLFNVSAVIPGQTQTIDVIQTAAFPLGGQHFFVGILGKGILGVSLVKSDRAGDAIFMSGIVSSSNGTNVIARAGVSKGVLSQLFEIGEGGGFVWVWSGIALSPADAPYSYQIRFSLAP
jgi:hypothetical protein